jgi:hypothetical protein
MGGEGTVELTGRRVRGFRASRAGRLVVSMPATGTGNNDDVVSPSGAGANCGMPGLGRRDGRPQTGGFVKGEPHLPRRGCHVRGSAREKDGGAGGLARLA